MRGGRTVNKKITTKFFLVLILIIILISLNTEKFFLKDNRSIPVWTNYEQEYYHNFADKPTGIKRKIANIKKVFKVENIIFYITGIRPRVPITYLKKEIPLLANYTPGVIKKEENILYQSIPDIDEEKFNIIQLKFNMKDDKINENTGRQENEKNIEIERRVEKKVIGIYHTHTSETYIDDPRQQDMNGHVKPGLIGNVAQVGRTLAKVLSKEYNFEVIHTTKVHDERYSMSYLNSRKTVKDLLESKRDFDLLLDIHRNGIENATREDVVTKIDGKRAAKIMFVVTNGHFDFAHLDLKDHHTQWQQNLNFARKLESEIKNKYPSLIQKPIDIRDTTYNQDLHPRAILVEIGDYKNTTAEAVYTARLLADVIAELLLE